MPLKTAATSLLELAAAAGAGTPRRSRGEAVEKSDLELMWGYDESPASAQGKAGRRQQQLAVGRVAHDDVLPRIDAKLQVGQRENMPMLSNVMKVHFPPRPS